MQSLIHSGMSYADVEVTLLAFFPDSSQIILMPKYYHQPHLIHFFYLFLFSTTKKRPQKIVFNYFVTNNLFLISLSDVIFHSH